VWWLLAPNPFVVLADAAPKLPAPPDRRYPEPVTRPADPLGEIGREVRSTRRSSDGSSGEPASGSGPVWPYGLVFDTALGAGALWITIRRLRTPARKLAKGVRVG
jgi:hypothetical protein